MSPIIIINCSCSPKSKLYINVPKEVYFKERIDTHDWQLEYSKKVKEEKYDFYRKNVLASGDHWIESGSEAIICKKCGKTLEI